LAVRHSVPAIDDGSLPSSEQPSQTIRPRGGTGCRGLRIGIDATCWNNDRGYGRHARALLSALLRSDDENHYTLFFDAPPRFEPPSAKAELSFIASRKPTSVAASADGHRSVGDMMRTSRAMSDRRLDLLIFPTIYSFVPVLSRARKIVFIHDVIAETFPQLTVPRLRSRLFWKAKVALGRWQADALATVSDYSRRQLMEYFRLPADRVAVVGEASDPVFRRLERLEPSPRLESLGLAGPGRMVMYVGGFGPHKNLDRLVRVFAGLCRRPEFDDVRLIMVGEFAREVFHSHVGAIRDRVAGLGIDDRVVFTGYLLDEDLVGLLNRATVLALPSLMEGFGLPAIEAAACGCPVVATINSPLPELLGEGGLYIDPGADEPLDEALRQVLSSEGLRARMRHAGLAAAGQLTWEAAAGQLRDIIREVATRWAVR
jgi:glycosyltransferase involved in cell wall biosynthesis